MPAYRRVPALGTHEAFIAALATLVREALQAMDMRGAGELGSAEGGRLCPAAHGACPLAAQGA